MSLRPVHPTPTLLLPECQSSVPERLDRDLQNLLSPAHPRGVCVCVIQSANGVCHTD